MISAIDTFVTEKDVTYYVRRSDDSSAKSTIVFLHDSLGCVQLWRDFPEKLCNIVHCNMLIYDRQGYGKSSPLPDFVRTNDYLENEADVLYGLLERYKLKNVIVFGHSDGGSIALIAAGKYPAMFKAVIVEAAHVFVEEITLQGIRKAVDEYANTNLKTRLEKYHGDKTDTVFNAWTHTWLSEQFRSWNIEHFLPAIACPLLFLQGEEDEYGTVRQIEAVKTKIRSMVRTLMIPDCRHTPHKGATDLVIRSSHAFISSLNLPS